MKVTAKIQYSFSCDACGHWWQTTDLSWEEGKTISCPHCHKMERLPGDPLFEPNFTNDTNLFRKSLSDRGFSALYETLPSGELRAVPEGWVI